MSDVVKFRLGNRDDTTCLLKLFKSAFRTPLSEKEWEWFAYTNPYGIDRVYLMENSDKEGVGCYCVSPSRALINHQICDLACPHHLVILQAYRGGQTFVDFSRFMFEHETQAKTRVLITAPNKNAYLPQKMLVRWSDFGFMDCLYKLCPQSQSHECKSVETFTSEFEDLFRTVAENLAFCFEKSASWLNWRYRDHPSRPYTTFAFYESSRLEGFIVLKRWQELDGYRKAHIMDLWALTDYAVTQLLAAAETYTANCDELNLWCVTGYPYRKQLEANGFVVRESSRQPIIALALDGINLPFPTGSASFMYGDGDGY